MNIQETGKIIVRARKTKKMTQADLADKLGVTDKAVSKWERGLSFPDISLLQPLSECLEISISELVEGKRHEEVVIHEVDAGVVATIEVSAAEIKRRTSRVKAISFTITSLVIVIAVVLSVCFGIAFTPTDGMTKTKQIALMSLNGGEQHIVRLSQKVRINEGDMLAFGMLPIQKKGKSSAELFNDVKKDILESGAEIYIDNDLDGFTFFFKNEEGYSDIFHLGITQTGVEITDMTYELYLSEDTNGYFLLPFPFIAGSRKDNFRILCGQELMVYNSISTALEDFEEFYLASGFYDVQKQGDSLSITIRNSTSSLLSTMIANTIHITFVNHGGVTFCVIDL